MANGDEVHRLAVAIEPRGMQETQEELDKTSKKFEDTSDDVKSATTDFSKFTRKFKGAGIVFAAGFGTLVAAVAAKLPILREVASGLDILLTSLALKIDESIRPALQDLTQDFVDLAGEISDAETAAEGIGLILGGVSEVLARRLTRFDPELSAEVTVDFFVEVGEVTVNRSGLRDEIVRAIEDPVPLLIEVFKLLQIPTAFVFNLGKSIGEELADGIIEEVDKAFADARARLNRLRGQVQNFARGRERRLMEETIPDEPFGGAGADISRPPPGPGMRRRGGGGGGGDTGSSSVIAGSVETEINLDGRRIGKAAKPFTVRGALGRGRGARMR